MVILMLNNLNEANRPLSIIYALSAGEASPDTIDVVNACKSTVYGGRISNHQDTIDFCINAGLVKTHGTVLELTDLGKEFRLLNTEHYEINKAQRDLLARSCFIEGPFSNGIIELLRQFTLTNYTYRWSPVDSPPMTGNNDLITLLDQCGILVRDGFDWIIPKDYVNLVYVAINGREHITEAELKLRLQRESEIGDIAETIVLKNETDRLRELGCTLEAEFVNRISQIDVAAGYDIASFNGKCPSLLHDRLIEVKGSTGQEIEFYISRNEVERARELGSKYWIYFVSKINLKTGRSDKEIIKINDPITNIMSNSNFIVEPELFSVKRSLDKNNKL